jgi:SAM-dependent methyltransferase
MKSLEDDNPAMAMFLRDAIHRFGSRARGQTALDFGCGKGRLVEELSKLGFDAFGCDIAGIPAQTDRLRLIERSPYHLPFPDSTFDVVVSTAVLEHASNKEECFLEIRRVLKPGGLALHLYPSKWYVPKEPHLFVPLVNWFWPHVPRWWLMLWARLGVRNEFQTGQSWHQVLSHNADYCATQISYWTTGRYRRSSEAVFGNAEWPMRFYIQNAPGGMARLGRRLRAAGLVGLLAREFREGFLLQRKN